MSYELQLALAALASAGLGSIPFSLLIARYFAGIDLRQHGSGNVGATNVARTMGPKWGMIALLMDAAKGIVPTLVFPMLMSAATSELFNERVLCGACAVLGHMFPPWLGFKGGKGVATALGVVCVLAPISTGLAFLAFVITFALSRIVSMSSIVASLVYTIAEFSLRGSQLWAANSWGLGVFAVAIPLLIIVRHRMNIVRLSRGEEGKFQFKKKPPATPPEEH